MPNWRRKGTCASPSIQQLPRGFTRQIRTAMEPFGMSCSFTPLFQRGRYMRLRVRLFTSRLSAARVPTLLSVVFWQSFRIRVPQQIQKQASATSQSDRVDSKSAPSQCPAAPILMSTVHRSSGITSHRLKLSRLCMFLLSHHLDLSRRFFPMYLLVHYCLYSSCFFLHTSSCKNV